MLFRRRKAESFLERLRVHLWPRRSWSRSTRYIVHRVRRLSATPHAVALGFAAGVFVSATPFIGFHMVLAALTAWIIGGSIVAAILGTFVGNPLTYAFFWIATFEVGSLMLGGSAKDLHLGGAPVLLTAGFPGLSPMMGVTHGVHGIGETIVISVHAAESAIGDIDAYVERLEYEVRKGN